MRALVLDRHGEGDRVAGRRVARRPGDRRGDQVGALRPARRPGWSGWCSVLLASFSSMTRVGLVDLRASAGSVPASAVPMLADDRGRRAGRQGADGRRADLGGAQVEVDVGRGRRRRCRCCVTVADSGDRVGLDRRGRASTTTPVTVRSGFGAGVPKTWNSATCPPGAPVLVVIDSSTSATAAADRDGHRVAGGRVEACSSPRRPAW